MGLRGNRVNLLMVHVQETGSPLKGRGGAQQGYGIVQRTGAGWLARGDIRPAEQGVFDDNHIMEKAAYHNRQNTGSVKTSKRKPKEEKNRRELYRRR